MNFCHDDQKHSILLTFCLFYSQISTHPCHHKLAKGGVKWIYDTLPICVEMAKQM